MTCHGSMTWINDMSWIWDTFGIDLESMWDIYDIIEKSKKNEKRKHRLLQTQNVVCVSFFFLPFSFFRFWLFWDRQNGQKSGPNKIKHVPGPRNTLKNQFLDISWIYYIII